MLYVVIGLIITRAVMLLRLGRYPDFQATGRRGDGATGRQAA